MKNAELERIRDTGGRFIRCRAPWTPENWDDGFVNEGYRIVYAPDFPGRTWEGYVKRAHVVLWLNTGELVGDGMVVHHISGDRLDDRPENLRLKARDRHTADHNDERFADARVECTCQACGVTFSRPRHLARRSKRQFCSQSCCFRTPKELEHQLRCAEALEHARLARGSRHKTAV